MKILFIGKTNKGGMKTHINLLMQEMSKKHDVKLISHDDFKNISILSGYYYLNIFPKKNIKKLIDWCDVVHLHVPSFSYEFRIKQLVKNKPMVITYHLPLGHDNLIDNPAVKLMNKMGKATIRFYGKFFSGPNIKYIPVGKILHDLIKKYNDSVVINNCMILDLFKKKKSKRYFDEFTLGYLGRVDIEKNVENLIKAAIDLNMKLVVVGMGLKYDRLKKKYQNKNVLFYGEMSYPPVDFYNSIDVFCSPTYLDANISLTVLESMACQTPVLVSSCGGEEEDIDKSFGIVSNPDYKSLKKNILMVSKMDYKKMGINARKILEKNYDFNDMVEKTEGVYKEILIKCSKK